MWKFTYSLTSEFHFLEFDIQWMFFVTKIVLGAGHSH
jgi:hypothetical protein